MFTLTALPSLDDAYLLRSMLEASEIPAFIPDENASLNWGYINAIGGVRVQVPEEFAENAKSVLAQFNDKSRSATIPPQPGLPQETDFADPVQVANGTNTTSHRTVSAGGGLVFVLLAFAVVAVFLVILERGRLQQSSFLAAQSAFNEGNYDQAIADYNRSIRFGLKSEIVYFNRGLAYTHKGDYDMAVADFSRAGQLEPQDEQVYSSRGYAYEQKGEYAKAIEDFIQALGLDPRDEQAYLNRGFSFDEKGEFDKAIADYSQAIQLNPKDEYAFCNRGKAHCDKAEYDAALADLNQAVLIDPSDTQAFFNRGDVYQQQGQLDKAIADFSQVIGIDPEGPKAADAYCNRALSYEAKGDYQNAIADCNQAIRLNPGHKYAYTALAWILATSPQAHFRDGKRAVEAATKACEMTDWKNPDALDTLAAAYAEVGDFASAVKWEREYLASPSLSSTDASQGKSRLALFEAHKPYREGK